jgi:hypothetical protein
LFDIIASTQGKGGMTFISPLPGNRGINLNAKYPISKRLSGTLRASPLAPLLRMNGISQERGVVGDKSNAAIE